MQQATDIQGESIDIPVITGPEFASRFVLRPGQYAWFLGAGASASAGIPTGYDMIRDFKTQLFCRETKLPRREVDSADPLWMARIDDFFSRQSILPPAGHPTEYAKAFEAVYPTAADRRAYIAMQVKQGRPSFAHRLLACLLVTKQAPCVFTTNFDNLVETASTVAGELLESSERASLVVAAIDNAQRAHRCLEENDWPLLAKIHGDFQSVELKNTDGELASQDALMRGVMVQAFNRYALIVVGYSGRDTSVMDALNDALEGENPYPGGVYWVTRSASQLLPSVQSFLASARAKGVNAFVLEAQNFDEFAGDVLDVVSFSQKLEKHLHEDLPSPIVRPMPLPTHEALNFPVLRCSALRLSQIPTVARRLSLEKSVGIQELRRGLKESRAKVVIAAAEGDFAAFGSDEELLRVLSPFGPRLLGTIALNPEGDSWALGLLYDALTRALCRRRALIPRLQSRGHSILVSAGHADEDDGQKAARLRQLAPLKAAYGGDVSGRVPKLGYPFNEALRIRLEQTNGCWWCVFEPFTNVDLPKEEPVEEGSEDADAGLGRYISWRPNPAADWIRERWAMRYNAKWNAIIDAWSKVLSGPEGTVRSLWLEEGQGINAEFDIGSVTAWSRPSHNHAYFQGGRR